MGSKRLIFKKIIKFHFGYQIKQNFCLNLESQNGEYKKKQKIKN